MHPLPRAFYERDTVTVAQELLGKYLIHHIAGVERVGKIVEVEAYLGPHDLAAHSSKGLTPGTQIMFGPAGHAYIYLIYGMHYCTNIVTENVGSGSAVLLRALEPVQNISLRCQGPGLLSKAMAIDKKLYGHDLEKKPLYVGQLENSQPPAIIAGPRIGVHYAQEWALKPLRFYIKDNPFVSRIQRLLK